MAGVRIANAYWTVLGRTLLNGAIDTIPRVVGKRVSRVERPSWARKPRVALHDLSPAESELLNVHRSIMLAAFDASVERYLLDTDLTFDGPEWFPSWDRLTGAYYLSDETYFHANHRGGKLVASLMAHCIEKPWNRDDGTLVEDLDYLGLDVGLAFDADSGHFSEVTIDSSSI